MSEKRNRGYRQYTRQERLCRDRIHIALFTTVFSILFLALGYIIFFRDIPPDEAVAVEITEETASPLPTTTPRALEPVTVTPTAPTPTAASEPTPAPTPEPQVDGFIEYNVPLSYELQRYTFDLCESRGVSYEMVLALMSKESTYRVSVVSATNDYGIMQINECNHEWLRGELGITDFLDPKQNIDAGTYIISLIAKNYDDIHQILMAYNLGESRARDYWAAGTYSTKYSRKIVAEMETLEVKK